MTTEYGSLFPSTASPAADAPPYVYVGFGERFAARIIDTVLHYGVGIMAMISVAILAFLVQALGGPTADATMARMDGEGFWPFVASLVGILIYETLCEGLFGSTAGKYMLGMVVLKDDGTRCTLQAALKRSVAFFVDSLFFGLIAWNVMKDSPEKKRVGDNWAETIVVKRKSAPAGVLHRPLRFAIVFLVAIALDGILIGVGMLF